MAKKALITGVTGQDGAYLVKCLLNKGYQVYGTYRRTSCVDFGRLAFLNVLEHDLLSLTSMDITDFSECLRTISEIEPDEIYNLAAQSFVGLSFSEPIVTSKITGLAVLNILEAIRICNKNIRFYQASSSEMFGKVQSIPQNENTVFYPRSPYGVAKLYAHWMTINYREAYGLFASSGILFNHESPLRGLEFVTRKISSGIAQIALGVDKPIKLGNLEATRDWGYAEEFVEGMYLILQHHQADSFVLATEKNHSIKDFFTLCCEAIDIEVIWEGEDEKQIGIRKDTGKIIASVDPSFYRPTEVDALIGDASKAKANLNWRAKTPLRSLCKMMVEADITRLIGKTSE